MANFDRIHVAQTMEEQGLVPLFYNSDIDLAKSLLKACYDGGARLLEFTNRGCLLYTSPSPRDQRGSRMPSSA